MPFGQPRPEAVIDKVGFTVDKIRADVHSDPFLRPGLNGIKKSLGR